MCSWEKEWMFYHWLKERVLGALHCDVLVLRRGCTGAGEGMDKGDKVIFPFCFLVGSYVY